ncbi:MAG: S41 family peptidase [Myxococcales bacterium]
MILDLRDNTGGNDSAWFLDWWAPRPYANHFIDYVLYEDFEQFRRARPVGLSGRDFDLYRKAHESRAPGQRFWRRQPFFGRPEGCTPDQRCVPGHPVTALPVALLVGPRCMSACDSFAQVFRENRFGPLVGEPPSAAYSLRAELPVRMPRSGKWLGTMHLAYTREQSGATGESLEGRLLELDRLIERTFENRERYGLLLIDAAIEALAGPPWAGEEASSELR